MQHTSNLLYAIHAVHQKPKPFQLPFSLYLKGPHDLSRRFQLNESHLAAGEKHDAVRHPIETGRGELGRDAAHEFHFSDQSLFYGSFFHVYLRFQLLFLIGVKILTRVYVCMFPYFSLFTYFK